MKQKIHTSWLVAFTAASFVIGVWSCLYISVYTGLVTVSLASIVTVFLLRFGVTIPLLVLASIVLGNCYGSQERASEARISPLYGQVITLTGSVKEDINRDSKNGVKIQLQNLNVDGHPLSGTLWIGGTTKAEVLRGDEVTISGELKPGFGTFVGMMTRVTFESIVHPEPGDIGRQFRDWFASLIRKGINEPQASLGAGYLTGQKSALPEDLSAALQVAGLTHIVVASGYNLTILVRLARRLFIRWSKYLSAISAAAMIVCFVAVTGLSPSMTRAGIVSGFSLLAWYYGRAFHPFVLLAIVAGITVVWQPSYAWGDIGWQLSFAAFAGVMVVAPLLQQYFFGKDPPGIFRQVLGETIAAHLVTLPIILSAFGALSHVAIIANVLIVPLVPFAMLLTFIVGCTALAIPMAAEWVGLPAQWILTYMTSVATWVSELPWAQTLIQAPVWALMVYIVILIAACLYAQRVTGFRLREANPIE
jgi:competence protein ComEC